MSPGEGAPGGSLLDGQRLVVTGAAAGIGAAIARRAAAAGAQVAVVDIDEGGADAVAAEVGGVAVTADVADPDAMAAGLDRAAEALGGLTGLVNNAGVGNLKALHTYTDREWARLVGVNLTGTFNGLRAVVPHLRAAGGGTVVNIASVSGMWPTRGEAPYAAAKAGVISLTKSAALEYGPDGIRVNCVSPGFILTALTEMAVASDEIRAQMVAATPLGRLGSPEEVADAVVFLCSPLARYVTGHNLVVDGGSLLPNAQVDGMLTHLLGMLGTAGE